MRRVDEIKRLKSICNDEGIQCTLFDCVKAFDEYDTFEEQMTYLKGLGKMLVQIV